MFHILYGGTYRWNKVTHWLLEEILFLQKLKKTLAKTRNYRRCWSLLVFQRRWCPMDFKERLYFFGKGSYNGCEGANFVWVFTTMLLHRGWPFVRVEITWPFESSKSMYNVKIMILLFFILIILIWCRDHRT